jgi:hypothetical protein
VAQAHDPGNRRHRQSLAIGRTDRLIALTAQLGGLPFERRFALDVVLGKGRQAGSGIRGLAFSSGYTPIV